MHLYRMPVSHVYSRPATSSMHFCLRHTRGYAQRLEKKKSAPTSVASTHMHVHTWARDRMHVHMPIHMSMHVSTRMSIRMHLARDRMHVHMPIHMSIHVSARMSIRMHLARDRKMVQQRPTARVARVDVASALHMCVDMCIGMWHGHVHRCP